MDGSQAETDAASSAAELVEPSVSAIMKSSCLIRASETVWYQTSPEFISSWILSALSVTSCRTKVR